MLTFHYRLFVWFKNFVVWRIKYSPHAILCYFSLTNIFIFNKNTYARPYTRSKWHQSSVNVTHILMPFLRTEVKKEFILFKLQQIYTRKLILVLHKLYRNSSFQFNFIFYHESCVFFILNVKLILYKHKNCS